LCASAAAHLDVGVSVVSDYFLSDAETIALLAEQSPLAIP